jgi:UDP-N-acetylmuramoyl-L-alanyl-D-glutamate--2,6-diaminopimelate ligase
MARWFVDRHPQRGIPSVSLRRLLPEARFVGCEDFEASGCTADSRRLDPGQVFVAVRGERFDGHAFVAQALERGAAGVVVERPCPEAGRPQVVVPDSRAALARLCQALVGDPSESLITLGVTGTAGRTVTALLLRAVFEAAGGRFGLISRLGWSDGRAEHPVGAGVSGPGAEGLAAMLARMVEAGCAGAVVELGPDALERRRVEGVAFDAAAVTDLGGPPALGPEALTARRNASARLVKRVAPGGAAVVNADEPACEILGAVNLDARRVTFGLSGPADVSARVERLDRSGSRFVLRGFDREARVALRLPGERAVAHALAAAAVAHARGLDVGAVVAGLESVAEVPGRLEPVDEGQPFEVRVDGSRHAAEAQDALEAVRSVTPAPGRVHCVFGAEGARGDGDGRPGRLALAASAEALADRLTLTADNPRTEDPDQILDDLLAGLRRPGRARVEPDRTRAIEAALADARPGDAVLLLGKGRQTFQIFADRAEPFDDVDVARRWLRRHRPGSRQTSA